MTVVGMSHLATRIAERRDTVAADPLLDPIAASHLATQLAPTPQPRYAILEATIPVSLLGDLSLRPALIGLIAAAAVRAARKSAAGACPATLPRNASRPLQ